MARIPFYYLAMTIFFVACDDTRKLYDTEFIDSGALEDLMKLGDKQELKKQLATYVAAQVSYIKMRIMEKDFLTYFECAFTGWKPVLEDVYKSWHSKTDLPPLTDEEVPKIPDDIVNLNSTRDQWFDDYQPKSFPARRLNKRSSKRTRINLFQFYKNWYNLITSDLTTPFVKELKEKLSGHKENFSIFYEDKDIQVRFAACISRSFLLVCTTCHRVLQDLQHHFKAHPRDSFTDNLFELVPYWHLSEETIVYINILRSTLSSVLPESLGKCIKGTISCFPAENKKNDSVCLPYLFSKECSRVDFMKSISFSSGSYRLPFVNESHTYPVYPNNSSKYL